MVAFSLLAFQRFSISAFQLKIMSAKKSLSQQAYDELRYQIIALQLEPGQVIDEPSLQASLGLGRTPIREALQRLAQENLVTIVPRRGMFVAEIGLTDLQRLFELRLSLETLAARLAAVRGQEAHWQEMELLLAEVRDLEPSTTNNERFSQLDEAFHQMIWLAADNRFLQDSLRMLYGLNLRLWYFALAQMGSMAGTVHEHEQILAALRRREADEAATVLAQHMYHFREEIQQVLSVSR
jgi:DNA-binding GntR family transcriptional regulator